MAFISDADTGEAVPELPVTATLRRGGTIDLNGSLGSLDFDLATGEAKVDQALLCAALDDEGKAADSIESGVLFKSAEDKLEGSLKCP